MTPEIPVCSINLVVVNAVVHASRNEVRKRVTIYTIIPNEALGIRELINFMTGVECSPIAPYVISEWFMQRAPGVHDSFDDAATLGFVPRHYQRRGRI